MAISYQVLVKAAEKCDLNLAGVLSCESAEQVLYSQKNNLKNWQEAGFAGEMSYMNRPPDFLLDAKKFLPGLKSVACFLINYSTNPFPTNSPVPTGFARVARYAWGRDYHKSLRKRLKTFVQLISATLPTPSTFHARVFSDSVPLLERALIVEATSGFVGKNTMFIVPSVGSFTFLAEVFFNVEVTEVPATRPSKGHCGSCSGCLANCPTKAFSAPYQLDARRCISYLTIEKRTQFTEWESAAIGDWIFGCDVCQEVCPFNRNVKAGAVLEEFSPKSGKGSLLDLGRILQLRSSAEFIKQFGGTALMRAGREALIRNACCVAANTKAQALSPLLKECLKDESEIVGTAAEWALSRM